MMLRSNGHKLALVLALSYGAFFSGDAFGYRLGGRWTTTATDGGGISIGDPITVTWGIVPDGTQQAGSAGGGQSDLIDFLDGIIGAGPGGSDLTQRPWFTYFEQSFNRWESVSGLSYEYEPNDDMATHSANNRPGILGVRADARIAGSFIDGASNILAFNFFPNNGDMTLDTGDAGFYGSSSQNYRRLRNTVMHEHGHGIGLSHVVSSGSRFLLEPFLSTQFDGPQFDDILGAHRGYGDFFEKSNNGNGNDSWDLATPLGLVDDGQTTEIGLNADSTVIGAAEVDFVSIDDDSDTDFYSFSIDSAADVNVLLTPMGPTYNEGCQGCSQNTFVSSQLSDLNVALFDTNGTSLLASDDSGGLGAVDLINAFNLSQSGQYFVRVKGAANNVQMYKLGISVTETVAMLNGDFDNDGDYDCADVDALVVDISIGANTAAFDLNSDGVVNTDDLDSWLAEAGAANLASGNPYLYGDATLDGNADASDFNAWNDHKFTNTASWCAGDFDASGSVDTTDFNMWNTVKFTSSDAGVSVVPEPGALSLLLLGLLSLWGFRRRR